MKIHKLIFIILYLTIIANVIDIQLILFKYTPVVTYPIFGNPTITPINYSQIMDHILGIALSIVTIKVFKKFFRKFPP